MQDVERIAHFYGTQHCSRSAYTRILPAVAFLPPLHGSWIAYLPGSRLCFDTFTTAPRRHSPASTPCLTIPFAPSPLPPPNSTVSCSPHLHSADQLRSCHVTWTLRRRWTYGTNHLVYRQFSRIHPFSGQQRRAFPVRTACNFHIGDERFPAHLLPRSHSYS